MDVLFSKYSIATEAILESRFCLSAGDYVILYIYIYIYMCRHLSMNIYAVLLYTNENKYVYFIFKIFNFN
jgi:hypothetical protein